MPSEPFYKFPHTPYLIPPSFAIPRQDKTLTDDEAAPFYSEIVQIEEKIDGANLGISFQKDGTIRLQNRGHYLSEPFTGQWKPLYHWLQSRIDILFDVLLDRYILFGEWCYVTHSVFYCKLPDWFIAFDLFDKESHRFLSIKKRNAIIKKAGIETVPQLFEGCISKEMILGFSGKSVFGEEEREGLYFRIDIKDNLLYRAKYVRPDFSQSIDTHWSKKHLTYNQLSNN